MASEIIIRKAELFDIENITVLKQQVWVSTYAEKGITKEFSDYVLSEFSMYNTRKSILDIDRNLLIAEIENHLIGCIEISFASNYPIPSLVNIPEISVLYVLEKFCGMGVGQKLLEEALLILKKKHFTAAWLTAYHKNHKALSFYKKNHFEMIGITHFEMSENKYENTILIREIRSENYIHL
ncbi:MAG: spermidine/spermine N(1)-acetyltransferase [Bacteroidetes bacterium]|nr:spermidine/spermine N(1)-acetyltransferase [Bacteroidota bacterium]